jgi:hypothetical protein
MYIYKKGSSERKEICFFLKKGSSSSSNQTFQRTKVFLFLQEKKLLLLDTFRFGIFVRSGNIIKGSQSPL